MARLHRNILDFTSELIPAIAAAIAVFFILLNDVAIANYSLLFTSILFSIITSIINRKLWYETGSNTRLN